MQIIPIKFKNKSLRLKVRDAADLSVVGEIFKVRDYRAAEPLLTAAPTRIIDAGAHIGVFTLYCRALNTAAEILAIEPDPQNRLLLQENLRLNDLVNIKILPQALAAKSGPRELIVAEENINHRLRLTDEPKGPRAQTVPVVAVSLADLPEKIDVIKLDIEGGEFEIIEQTASEILKRPKTWILEYHDGAATDRNRRHTKLEQKFKALGYGVQIFPSKFEKKLGFILATRK